MAAASPRRAVPATAGRKPSRCALPRRPDATPAPQRRGTTGALPLLQPRPRRAALEVLRRARRASSTSAAGTCWCEHIWRRAAAGTRLADRATPPTATALRLRRRPVAAAAARAAARADGRRRERRRMKTRPFLSHKRAGPAPRSSRSRTSSASTAPVAGATSTTCTSGELRRLGLRRGDQPRHRRLHLVRHQARAVSKYVNDGRDPARASRASARAELPARPVFVDRAARGSCRASSRDCRRATSQPPATANGEVRGRQTNAAFHRDVAQPLRPRCARGLDQDSSRSPPRRWPSPDGTRTSRSTGASCTAADAILAPGIEERLRDVAREPARRLPAEGRLPRDHLDLNLPLPLAMLIGYEWRVTTRLRLVARQRTRSGSIEVRGDGPVSGGWPNWTERSLGREGPAVFAVATTTSRST